MQRSDPLNLIQFTLAEGWCVVRGKGFGHPQHHKAFRL
jgi:hypothetical protein